MQVSGWTGLVKPLGNTNDYDLYSSGQRYKTQDRLILRITNCKRTRLGETKNVHQFQRMPEE